MSVHCCSNCGCNPCGCAYIVNLPESNASDLLFANIGTGIGTFDNQSGLNISFRGVASANAMLTATLDAVNHNILLTISSAAIAAALPAATTAQAGVLETATDAEAIAKVAIDKIVTPSNFAAMAATNAFAGLAEIATQAEVNAGVSSTTIVAPNTLAVLLATMEQTVTFADAVARAALVPAFEGQFGYQLDTNNAYVAIGAGAGAWGLLLGFGNGVSNVVPAGASVGIVFGAGATLDIDNGAIGFTGTAITTDTTTFSLINNSSFTLTGGTFDMDGSVFQIGGAPTAANTVICTSAAPGDLTDRNLNTFVTTANTSTGFTAFTNSAVLKTGDCNTITLPQLAQVVDTLIGTLRNVLLPAV